MSKTAKEMVNEKMEGIIHIFIFFNGGDPMARVKKYNVILTDDEVKQLKSIIRKKKTSKTITCRCQILLDIDETHGKPFTRELSAKSNEVCIATVSNTTKQYMENGLDSVITLKRNVNSNNSKT